MAKFELKFKDVYDTTKISCESTESNIIVNGFSENSQCFQIILDKSTAIKFAKTLRTEINKIIESEVKNE